MARVDELPETDIRQLVLTMPFKKFAQRGSCPMIGMHRGCGGGLSEIRIHYGSGYRVYFMQRGTALIILLCGGDKRDQTKSIESARRIAQDWLKAHP
jgi:putative addiction module killer protein